MTCKELYVLMRNELDGEAPALCWYMFGRSCACLLTDDRPVDSAQISAYEEYKNRLASGEPMQYIFGYAPFYGLELYCEPGVLIPRQDTETLVEYAVKNLPYGAFFADICCGSGCIAASVLHNRPDTTALCADISDKALSVTRKNLEKYGLSDRALTVKHNVFDTWDGLPTFDAILCNPPYINKKDMHALPENVKREPELALYGGEDGLDFYKRILPAAEGHFRSRTHIVFEIGYDQAQALKTLTGGKCTVKKDLSGNDRLCIIRGE